MMYLTGSLKGQPVSSRPEQVSGKHTSQTRTTLWSHYRELLETDPDFAEEFAQTFNNPNVPEADDSFDPDSYDSYLGMELALDRDGWEPQFARVSKRPKDNSGWRSHRSSKQQFNP
jgi:hypothetical protein